MSNGNSLLGMTGTKGEAHVLGEALRAIQGLGPLIYAVRTGDDLIKIGCSSDFATRRHQIKGGTAQILALKPGGFADELEIHRRLKGHASVGREYYFPTPTVMREVNTMRAALGMDPVVIERRWAS